MVSSSARRNVRRPTSRSRSGIRSIPRTPNLQIENAIRGLQNSATTVTTESKGGLQTVATSYPAELLVALRGAFPSSRTYTFQVHQSLGVSTSAGNATLGFVAISPSVASYSEWSALSALFDEVKAVKTNIEWLPITAQAVPMCMAIDEQNLNTDPASFVSVYRLAGSKTWTHQYGDKGNGRHHQSHRFASREWCDTSVPYSQSPIGGCIGCWVYANGILFSTASVQIATVNSITVMKFRCRA